MATNFWGTSTPSLDFYTDSTANSEIDIRAEFIKTFDGSFPEISKAQNGLLRRMRRDSNNQLIQCNCVDSVTKEPDKDRWCPICYGEGFLWDEEDIQHYKIRVGRETSLAIQERLTQPGLINVPLVVFYIRYDAEITSHDKIVELQLELNGDKSEPLRRIDIYKIITPWSYRLDNGKLEYWEVVASEENIKYLNAPSYGDL